MADAIAPPTITPPPAPPVNELGAGGNPAIPAAPPAGTTGHGVTGSWTDPDAVDRFADSATEAVTQGIHGAIGMGKEILNPPGDTEKAKIKDIAKTLILDPMAKQEMAARTAKTPWESIGHSIAEALPLVGPWVADVSEQTGKQAGTGDWAGAAGTAAGNALVAEAISHLTPGEAKEEPVKLSKETGLGPVKTPAAEAEAPVEMNRETVGKLKNLGYSNQQITNFDINEIGDILKNGTKAPPIDFAAAKGKAAEPKVEPKSGAKAAPSAAEGIPVESAAASKMVDMPANVARANGYQIEHAEGRQRFASGSEAPQSVNVVSATTGGKEVGRVNYKIDGDTASIKAAAVDPAHQQQGLGREMYLRAANEAQARGATSLTSDLQGTTSMDAARVWDGLIARGYPVEKIPSKPGSPGYRMDLTKPIEPAPQYWKALANRGEMPGQEYNFGPVYGETGGYVAPDVQKNTGKGYPRSPAGIQKYVDNLGSTTGTGLLPTPEHLIDTKGGESTESTLTHEYSHAFNALWDGLPVDGMQMRSHLHPANARAGAAADVTLPWGNLSGSEERSNGNVYFTPEAFQEHGPLMMKSLIGGPIGEELFHGINAETNRGAGGDRQAIRRLGKNLGLKPFETSMMARRLTKQVRDRMNDPRVQNLIHEFSQTREEGLNKAHLASPEKIQEFAKRVQALKQEIENEKSSGTYTQRSISPRSNPKPERVAGITPAGTTGGVSEGVSSGVGEGRAPAAAEGTTTGEVEKPAAYEDLVLQRIAERYGISNDVSQIKRGGTGAAFVTPDGKFINIPAGVTHDAAIDWHDPDKLYSSKPRQTENADNRIGFIDKAKTIRLRLSKDKAGDTMHISVPSSGVSAEQIPAVQQAIAQVGRYGNLVMERVDAKPETKDALTMTQEFPRVSDTEDYLRRIEAHPDQHLKAEGTAQKKIVEPEQNASVGYINPQGKFEAFDDRASKKGDDFANEYEHSDFAANRNTDMNTLRRQGWVRKAGIGTYDVTELTPKTKTAVERDIIQDSPILRKHPDPRIFLGTNAGLFPIPVDDFIDKYNGDLDKAMAGVRVEKKNGMQYISPSRRTGPETQTKIVPGETENAKAPNEDVQASAQKYNAAKGRESIAHAPVKLPPAEQRNALADMYEASTHAPNAPGVKKAYDAMKQETKAQFLHAQNDLGMKYEFTEKDPYDSAEQMMKDVRDNHHLAVYSGSPVQANHPLAEIDKETGQPYNNLFRAVHDTFGHAAGGNDFTEAGEHNAYNAHVQMYSSEAQPAVQNETRNQTNWLFNNKEYREGTKPWRFADQKAVILPESAKAPAPEVQHQILDVAKTFGDEPFTNNTVKLYSNTNDQEEINKAVDYLVNTGKLTRVDATHYRLAKPAESAWASIAADKAKTEPAGAIDPKTGQADTKGIGTEIFPEAREALDHPPTKEDFAAFEAKNAGFLAQYPEFRVGWDNNSNLSGGHEINIGGTGPGAAQVAKKLDQRAAFDIAKSEDIPTGGAGLRREFPNYPMEDRVKDLRGEPLSSIKNFEHLSQPVYDNLEPDEREYLKGNKLLQRNAMKQYHDIKPSVAETSNAMQAGAALGGWWKRYMDVFHGLAPEPELPSDTLWHGSPSGNLRGGVTGLHVGTKQAALEALNSRIGFRADGKDWDGTQKYGKTLLAGRQTLMSLPSHGFNETGFNSDVPEQDFYPKIGTAKYSDGTPVTANAKPNIIPVQIRSKMRNTPETPLTDARANNLMGTALRKGRLFDVGAYYKNEGEDAGSISAVVPPHGVEQIAQLVGPSHAETLKQWHAALSGNKKVEDANNLAWHSYADWLDAGKPTDRKSINDIIRQNGAQPEGSSKKGNAAVSDTLNKKGKVISAGLDTTKLFNLVNSPEMKGERPFTGDVFLDDVRKNPLMGTTEGARKIPSMGATVAGKGNLNRLVLDAHMRDFYGYKGAGGPAAQYIADSVHLRQAAQALGLKGGEGQEQLWGTVLGLKTLLKQGLTPEEAGSTLDAETIRQIGKDYAEVMENDPEISGPNGVLDRLAAKYGFVRGSNEARATYRKARSTSTSESGPADGKTSVDPALLAKTAERVRGQISPSKIKQAPTEEEQTAFPFGANESAEPLPAAPKPKQAKGTINAMDFLKGMSSPGKGRSLPVDSHAGKPINIHYMRNPNTAPNFGERFGQHIEPAGRYITQQDERFGAPKDWETGNVKFEKPLVIKFGKEYGDPDNWKARLSAAYGGKTGAKLSKALIADGYDGVITMKGNETSEIVDLSPLKK